MIHSSIPPFSFVENEIFDPNLLVCIHAFSGSHALMKVTLAKVKGIPSPILEQMKREHIDLNKNRVSLYDHFNSLQRSLVLEELIRESLQQRNPVLLKCVLESPRFSLSRDIRVLKDALLDSVKKGNVIATRIILTPTAQSQTLTRAVKDPLYLSQAFMMADGAPQREEILDLLVEAIPDGGESRLIHVVKILDRVAHPLKNLCKRQKLIHSPL